MHSELKCKLWAVDLSNFSSTKAQASSHHWNTYGENNSMRVHRKSLAVASLIGCHSNIKYFKKYKQIFQKILK